MHRVFFYFAFVAFCSAAPHGDSNWQRSFSTHQDRQLAPQTINVVNTQQQDESDIVDTLGGGYSFFKKQPIVSRPLIQQKLAINEQQVPMSSFDDTANQWSDYTKSSAFKQLPAKKHAVSLSNDLVSNGYGQQQSGLANDFVMTVPAHVRSSVSNGYGNQQEDRNARVRVGPKTFISRDQGGYGSAVGQEGQQTTVTDDDNSDGQQEDKPIIQQQPLNRNIDNSYGQQEVRNLVQQQPLLRNTGNSYGQQEVRNFVQQQQPLIRDADSSYGQQEVRNFVQQQQPLIRDADSSYGQQEIRKFVQQQPLVRTTGDSYGQQQDKLIIQQQPLIRNLDNSYGQQEVRNFVPQQQPLIRNLDNSYGQQEIRTLVRQQPLLLNRDNSYGQQEVRTVMQQQPLVRNTGDSYGQQEDKVVIQQQQPLLRNNDNSYNQQDVRTFVQQQPLIRNAGSSYGQDDQSVTTLKSNNGVEQRSRPIFNDFANEGGHGQQVQQKVLFPAVNRGSSFQPSFSSQHIDLPRNNALGTSLRTGSQSQSSDSGSFSNW